MNKWYNRWGEEEDVVVSSRIRLARNTTEYNFSPKITPTESETLIARASDCIDGAQEECGMKIVSMARASECKKQSLMENLLINRYMAERNDGAVGFSENESLSVMINAEDHFRIQAVTSGMDMNSCLITANSLDDKLGEEFEYAFSDKYGYQTTFITNIGTGMRAAYRLHLPALANTKKLQLLSGELGRFGVKLSPCYGDNNVGDIYSLSNQHTLGASEEEICKNLKNVALQLVEQERKQREIFLSTSRIKAEDEAYKSYGVLKYSRCMSLKNAMVLLSEIRLGQFLGTIKFKDYDFSAYGLMLAVQPRTIQENVSNGRAMSVEEVDIARAKIIRESIPELG